MDQVRRRLLYKFDELNAIEIMLTAGGLDKEYARKVFRDTLEDAYLEGYAASEYMIQQEEEIDEELLLLALDKEYDGISIYDKFDTYYDEGDVDSLKVLMDSEFHRCYGQGGMDMALHSGKQVLKTWETMQDDRVRETHDFLDGVTIPLGEKFVTLDMDEAMFPGDFKLPENVVNCRCWLSYSTE